MITEIFLHRNHRHNSMYINKHTYKEVLYFICNYMQNLMIQLERALKTGTFGTILLKYPYAAIYRLIFSLKFRNWEA